MAVDKNNTSSLYYTKEKDFSLDKCICEPIIITEPGRFSCTIKFNTSNLNDRIFNNELMFVPFEGYISKFYNIKCFDDTSKEINITAVNNLINFKDLIFFNTAPIFYIKTNYSESLTFIFEAEILNNDDVLSLCRINTNIVARLMRKLTYFTHSNKKELNTKFSKPIYISDDINFLFVVNSAEKGGTTLLALNILKHLVHNTKYKPLVLLLKEGPNIPKFEKLAPTINLDLFYYEHNTRTQQLEHILNMLNEKNVKTALCNSITTGIIADSLHKYNFKILTLIHELPELINFNSLTTAAENVAKFSNTLIFPSKTVKENFNQEFYPAANSQYIIPQGIYNKSILMDISEKKNYQIKLKNKLNISENTTIVLGCGNGYFVKGLDLFVQTAINVIKNWKKIHFVWLASFNNSSEITGKTLLQKQLLVEHCNDNFHFEEFTDDPSLYFSGSDIFYLSSRIDCYPSVVLEACDNYTPVIAYKESGGIQDFIENSKNGLLVPYCNTQQAGDEIIKLYNNVELRKNLAIQAKYSVKDYTMENYATPIIKIIEEKQNISILGK